MIAKRRILMISTLAMLFGLWIILKATASADVVDSQISVLVTPDRVSTTVGTATEITVSLANNSTEATPELAVHLDITDPRERGSVDPEDWTPTLTLAMSPLAPGAQETRTWSISPIQGGTFVLYAVALDINSGVEPTLIAVSNGVPVHVDEKRSFNPGGVLPPCPCYASSARNGLALALQASTIELGLTSTRSNRNGAAHMAFADIAWWPIQVFPTLTGLLTSPTSLASQQRLS